MDSGALAQQLASYDANRKNSVDVLNSAMSQYGVPEIRSRVAGLRTTLTNTENALNNVDPSVTGRTQGSLVTEAQRQKQVTNERAPIAQQYGQQQGALSNESASLTDSLNSAKTLADSQINDYNAGRTALQSEYDAKYQREQDATKLAEQQRQFDIDQANRLAASKAASSGFSFGGGASAASTAPKTDPVQQAAYNDAFSRVSAHNDQQLLSDYRATAKSAGYGNVQDQAKIKIYQQLRPDLFTNDNLAPSLLNIIGKPYR